LVGGDGTTHPIKGGENLKGPLGSCRGPNIDGKTYYNRERGLSPNWNGGERRGPYVGRGKEPRTD